MIKRLVGLSLFANAGIAEAYFKEIGVNIVLANEINPLRAKFYTHLYPDTEMVVGDITNDSICNNIVNKSIRAGVDFIIATPPCQGMSLAGKLDPVDPRNQLVSYAINIIKKVNPRFVLLENVPQQLKTKIMYKGKKTLIPDYIYNALKAKYNFNCQSIAKAMDYGVPQMRKRSIFLLSRKDTKILWEFPKKDDKVVTLKKAIGHLPSLDPFLRDGYKKTLEMFPNFEKKKRKGLKISRWHYPPTHALRHVVWMMRTPSGKTAFDNDINYPKKADGAKIVGHWNTYRRLDWNKPSRTMTQNSGVISSLTCVHPGRLIKDDGTEQGRLYSDPRCLSIYELLIVSSLPNNWKIPEWVNEKLVRSVIGEGIPPLLVKKIMQELIRHL